VIEATEEQEALIDEAEARREELLRRPALRARALAARGGGVATVESHLLVSP
jgi:hypothetical protein